MITHALWARPTLRRQNWKPLYWLGAMLTVLALQLACGTMPAYALLLTLFCLLTYLAVKAAGGPTTMTGFCVFYVAAQHVLVSQIAKLFFWDPADHNLLHPVTTMGVYACFMAGIYLAAAATRRLGISRRRPLFQPITDPTRLMWIAYISTAIYVLQTVYLSRGSTDAETGAHNYGGAASVLQQFNLLGLAVASGTAYIITASRGRRSLGPTNMIAIGFALLGGVLGASREGTISAAVLYFATCLMFRFRFRFIHYAVLIGGVCFAQYILFPYALYARSIVRTSDMQKNIRLASGALLDVLSDPARYQKLQNAGSQNHRTRVLYEYYDKPNSSLDRFTTIKVTDALVDATLREGTTGMDTITPGFLMPIPRFLYPDKPALSSSNFLAHREPGLVGKNDHTTGISTGFTGDAFSTFGWAGAVLIPFLLMFGWFCVLRFIFQDSLRQNIFALSLFLQLAHSFSEGAITVLVGGLLAAPFLYTLPYWLILRLTAFAMRTQEKIRAARQQAMVRGRSEVLAGRRQLIRHRRQ